MNVSPLVWALTLVLLVAVLAVDVVRSARAPARPSVRASVLWVTAYAVAALVFGIVVSSAYGAEHGGAFYAGWLTEYSLSVDNLFVFLVIMSRFRVPVDAQRTVLLVGVVLALLLRGLFIAAGTALIHRFTWVFWVFGLFLLWTAVGLLRGQGAAEEAQRDNRLVRLLRRAVPTTTAYDGVRLRTPVDGRAVFTPMLLVVVAIGSTDLLFALDSIPAIFGLTTEPYLVLAANAFALMGLVQLFFLLGGLLERLVYLSVGLAVVLGFIGVKLVLEALHRNQLPFVNGGRAVEWAPQVPVPVSLAVIVTVVGVSAAASLLRTGRSARPTRG